MATIKDIAKLAGVSQGTVSNVLNGKGNVSSSKILLVQDAARQLGYAINENAKLLRKGQSKTIAVIVPNNTDIQYIDFVTSFSNQARVMGYEAFVAYSQDNPDLERELIRQFRSLVVVGIVSFTSLGQKAGIIYRNLGFDTHNVLFVERRGGSGFIGFDYEKAGADMGLQLRGSGAKRVALVVEELATNDTEFAH
ncbi:MAG: LacI family DNA-binding transcriptional regulator [Sphaerochaetaceae bacterium]|nr:LacI family DNA-binding transcriptional regulator [Spirochaetales bacterium]MDY5500593.1 LacI family DNA-binding transcriptional regulator [Sphaerochaetaceae bacterium]